MYGDLHGMKTSRSDIEGQFADGDTHAICTQISQTQNAAVNLRGEPARSLSR